MSRFIETLIAEAILERYVGVALQKQMDFAEFIRGINNWYIDMTNEEIAFGPNLSFKTGKPYHQNYMGRLVAENGRIKLIREAPMGSFATFPTPS